MLGFDFLLYAWPLLNYIPRLSCANGFGQVSVRPIAVALLKDTAESWVSETNYVGN